MHRSIRLVVLGISLTVGSSTPIFADQPFPLKAKRILFLGDSITNSGHYVAWVETQVRLRDVQPMPQIIQVGLSSETCTGLSEPDHPFPRPDVHERLDRALAKVKPDVVVACYGMNDGIYYPFGKARFEAYQAGINKLVKKSHAAGAKVVLLTPPPFDPLPLRKKGKLRPDGAEKYAYFAIYENYDGVLKKYGQWIMAGNTKADMVIDVHTPVKNEVAKLRKKDPNFTLSGDGVHMNAKGHRIMGIAVAKAWGIKSVEPSPELLKVVTQRTTVLHDAWLSEIGHKRPGVRTGLPIDKAESQAQELEEKIQMLLKSKK